MPNSELKTNLSGEISKRQDITENMSDIHPSTAVWEYDDNKKPTGAFGHVISVDEYGSFCLSFHPSDFRVRDQEAKVEVK